MNRHLRILQILCIAAVTGDCLSAEALPENLGDWSPIVRSAAIKQAIKTGPETLPGLREALQSDNAGLRHSATMVIAGLAKNASDKNSGEWPAVTAALIEVLGSDRDFWTRCGAASALKSIQSQAAAPALIRAANDPNPWVAAASVDAISNLPVKHFGKEEYLTTAVNALEAPRSATRTSAVKMLTVLGPDGKKALPQVERSVATFSQDSMFADRPRFEAIVWISRYDRKKAAKLANGLLLEERWGAKGRYAMLVPFLQKLGRDAAPAKAGLERAAADKRNKNTAAKARQILNTLNQ